MRVPSASSETQTDFYNVNRWRGRRETLGVNRPASRRGRLRRNFPVAYFDVDIPNFFVTCPSVYAGGSVVALLRYGLVSIIPALPGQDRSSMLGVVVVRPAAQAARTFLSVPAGRISRSAARDARRSALCWAFVPARSRPMARRDTGALGQRNLFHAAAAAVRRTRRRSRCG